MEFLSAVQSSLGDAGITMKPKKGGFLIRNKRDSRMSIDVSISGGEGLVAVGNIYHRHYPLSSKLTSEEAATFIKKILQDNCYFTVVKKGSSRISVMCKDVEEGTVTPIYYLKEEEQKSGLSKLLNYFKKEVEEDFVWSGKKVLNPLPSLVGKAKELSRAASQMTTDDVVSLIEAMEEKFGAESRDRHNK